MKDIRLIGQPRIFNTHSRDIDLNAICKRCGMNYGKHSGDDMFMNSDVKRNCWL